MSEKVRIQVLLDPELAERFRDYCAENGFKKSTLIEKLVRDLLRDQVPVAQQRLFREAEQGTR